MHHNQQDPFLKRSTYRDVRALEDLRKALTTSCPYSPFRGVGPPCGSARLLLHLILPLHEIKLKSQSNTTGSSYHVLESGRPLRVSAYTRSPAESLPLCMLPFLIVASFLNPAIY